MHQVSKAVKEKGDRMNSERPSMSQFIIAAFAGALILLIVMMILTGYVIYLDANGL